jgi:hypothetical protein
MTDRTGHSKPARVVAELGRPETPSEIGERKAEASRTHRANQTSTNLIVALLASLAVVLLLVLVTVRTNQPAATAIDYRAVAAAAQVDAAEPLASPALPRTWSANAAEIRPATADKIVSWYIGFITPAKQFIGLSQGAKANDTWISNQVQSKATTGTTTIDGIHWTIYDHRTAQGAGNLAYAMSTTVSSGSYVLFGTASDGEFHTLATALGAQITEENR